MKTPKSKECKCWENYPNPNREERCAYYECIQKHTSKNRTICRLKEEYDNLVNVSDGWFNKKDYTLHDGAVISVLYDNNDVCRVSKDAMEVLIGLYEQGRADAYKDFWEKFTRICGYTDFEKNVADSLLNGTYEEDYGD